MSSFRVRTRESGALALACIAVAASASALPAVRTAFFTEYPGAAGTPLDTVPSRPGHCGACHYSFSGTGGGLNPYGDRLGQVLGSYPNTLAGRREAIRSIEDEDSDGDGDRDGDDLALLIAVLLGTETNPEFVARCDLNFDAETNGLDIEAFVELNVP